MRGGKAYATKQILRKLKKRIFRLKALEKKIKKDKRTNSYEITKKSVGNMNSLPTAKYKQISNDVK